jgi:hypothetical protein
MKRQSASAPLYARILGTTWSTLPREIRALHDFNGSASAKGRASVERGRGLLAGMAGALIGFPKAVPGTPVSVRFDALNGSETWTRTFGESSFSTQQFAGTGRSKGLLCERFGPPTFAMTLVWDGERLALVLRRWSALGVPLPMWLCPRSNSHEAIEDGRFHFHVEIGHPLTGLIVRYRGWLARS